MPETVVLLIIACSLARIDDVLSAGDLLDVITLVLVAASVDVSNTRMVCHVLEQCTCMDNGVTWAQQLCELCRGPQGQSLKSRPSTAA